jgi:hypothetical protein
MHNRRLGSFLMGGWLLGTILVWFVTSQNVLTVERILSAPPQQVQKEFDDLGPEVTRQILRFEAHESNRRIVETWDVLKLGLAAALLATAVLTSSRSKIVVVCAALIMAASATMALYLTPSMNALSSAYDFLPPTVATREREAFQRLDVWHRVLDVLSILLALVVSARLLFDFYEFGARLAPESGGRKRRRHRRPSASAGAIAHVTSHTESKGTPDPQQNS